MSFSIVTTQNGVSNTYTATADAELCLEQVRLSQVSSVAGVVGPTYATIKDMATGFFQQQMINPALIRFIPPTAVADAMAQSLATAALQAALIAAGYSPVSNLRNLLPPNTQNSLAGGFNDADALWSGFTKAPDGSQNGVLITQYTGGTGAHYFYIYSDLGPGQHTISSHFKQATGTIVYLQSEVDGTFRQCWFDLDVAAVGTNNFPGTTTPVVLQVTPDGWCRCSITFTATTSAIYNGFGISSADGTYNEAGTIGLGVDQWGQQFEHGPLTAYQSIPLGG